jgi:hypothetical protein
VNLVDPTGHAGTQAELNPRLIEKVNADQAEHRFYTGKDWDQFDDAQKLSQWMLSQLGSAGVAPTTRP